MSEDNTVGSTSATPSLRILNTTTPNVARGRIYRTVVNGQTKWVTRDLAALDFLLGIPMERESSLVHSGWLRNQQPAPGKWWEKFIRQAPLRRGSGDNDNVLEQPGDSQDSKAHGRAVVTGGRRLDGDNAKHVTIPRTGFARTRQRSIARQAAIREWELQVAHGLRDEKSDGLLDGRVFFSSKENYPISVFSVIKYEPKREEAARLRQKLEARGGGGTQFVVPERDWRGTSYHSLLDRHEMKNRKFNRFIGPETEDDDSDVSSSSSSDDDDAYVPGFLDDPAMVQGRNRNVVIGDRVTGCIVSSTIQFVKPADLKADLNKQFRERFDGWEPPKSQLKFIGAKVIDGIYTLIDPKDVTDTHDDKNVHESSRRARQGSISSPADAKETIRMPPSLTLSKIRSIKQQALKAAVKARLEISTVALACVYFERLCLDCRVDKSNRRLSFAACLLLAAKINESNIGLVMRSQEEDDDEKLGLQSLIRPTKKSNTMFASLLEFFTQDWELSLKHLFSAEWGVFAALGFELHASPSQVSFHFRRLMKVLEWRPLRYLGTEMYNQWQDCLITDERRREEREQRREYRRAKKERKLLKLELKLKLENEKSKLRASSEDWHDAEDHTGDVLTPDNRGRKVAGGGDKRKGAARKLLNRLTMKRAPSATDSMMVMSSHVEKIKQTQVKSGISKSSSLPLLRASRTNDSEHEDRHIAIDINLDDESNSHSFDGAVTDDEGIII